MLLKHKEDQLHPKPLDFTLDTIWICRCWWGVLKVEEACDPDQKFAVKGRACPSLITTTKVPLSEALIPIGSSGVTHWPAD